MSHELTPSSLKASLDQHFGNIEDPRDPAKTAHKLLDIITIAVMAVLCGAEGSIAVETYGKAQQDWLATFLALPNAIASHDTFGRVFSLLNPEAMEKHFQTWVRLMVSQLFSSFPDCLRSHWGIENS